MFQNGNPGKADLKSCDSEVRKVAKNLAKAVAKNGKTAKILTVLTLYQEFETKLLRFSRVGCPQKCLQNVSRPKVFGGQMSLRVTTSVTKVVASTWF